VPWPTLLELARQFAADNRAAGLPARCRSLWLLPSGGFQLRRHELLPDGALRTVAGRLLLEGGGPRNAREN